MPSVRVRTIVVGAVVVGHVASYEQEGLPEATYWIGRAYWGRGLATAALAAFLQEDTRRPMYGHAAKDNAASRRVMAKCGFKETGVALWYANARGAEIEEVALVLE